MRKSNDPNWEVPYLPMDPEDVGRTYEAVIRINSQSGKGGIAYLLEKDHGLSMPRRLQIEFSQNIQKIADESGKEILPETIWKSFQETYLGKEKTYAFLNHQISSSSIKGVQRDTLSVNIKKNKKEIEILGTGNGPIDAFIEGLNQNFNIQLKISDYHQHAISSGSDASAVAYVEISKNGSTSWGVGINSNTVIASLEAVISGLNRL
jgi:2-isopropylmalate synthase